MRRTGCWAALAALVGLASAADAPSQQAVHDASGPGYHHGFSFFRELRYPPDYRHFDYVNPQAPIGGELVLPMVGTCNSFTPWIQKGINPAGYGFVGAGIYLFDRILEPGDDDPSAQYARLGELEAAPDYSWFKVRIHPEARWHDGVPVTPADILFTADFVVNYASAPIRTGLARFGRAEQVGEREVKIRITNPAFRNPSAGLSAGHLPILPARYWAERDITMTTVEPPLGSGPYRIAEFDLGRRVVYERVPDYRGWDVPSVRGKYNYERIVFECFRDNTVAREATRKGIVTFRGEGVAKDWATSCANFPARDDGYFILELAERRDITAMAASVVLNTRREHPKAARLSAGTHASAKDLMKKGLRPLVGERIAFGEILRSRTLAIAALSDVPIRGPGQSSGDIAMHGQRMAGSRGPIPIPPRRFDFRISPSRIRVFPSARTPPREGTSASTEAH